MIHKKESNAIVYCVTYKNKMSADEEQDILDICVQPEYVDKTPPYIVPHLADRGRYIASEFSFYRVHRKNKLDTKRTLTKTHNNQTITTHIALGPNQVWSWDYSDIKVIPMFTFVSWYIRFVI